MKIWNKIKNRIRYWWDIDICKKHHLKTIPANKVKDKHLQKLSRSGIHMIRNKKNGRVVVFNGDIDAFRKSSYNNEQYELVESKIR